jgi:hypothetical protein
VPKVFDIEVILPAGANASNYELELWNGSVLPANSTTATFTPPVGGGSSNLWAKVVLAANPTVQVADDNEETTFSEWQKAINAQVTSWIGDLATSGFKSALKSQIDGPFADAKTQIDAAIAELDPVDPTEQVWIANLTTFRDTELPALQDQMVDGVAELVFDTFSHTGNATVRNGSEALDALNAVDSVDTSTALSRDWIVSPSISFELTDEIKDGLEVGDVDPLRQTLLEPWKLISDIGLGVRYHFDTEAFLEGSVTLSNLQEQPEKSTYKANLNLFQVPADGALELSFGISSEYTPETDAKSATINLSGEFRP